jgi:hypothetical protein
VTVFHVEYNQITSKKLKKALKNPRSRYNITIFYHQFQNCHDFSLNNASNQYKISYATSAVQGCIVEEILVAQCIPRIYPQYFLSTTFQDE